MGEQAREQPIWIKPAHIRSTWEALITPLSVAEEWGKRYGVPDDWGRPIAATVWCDADGKARASALEYANGRRLETRHRKADYSATFCRAFGSPLPKPTAAGGK